MQRRVPMAPRSAARKFDGDSGGGGDGGDEVTPTTSMTNYSPSMEA